MLINTVSALAIELFSSRYKTWTTIFHCLMFVKPTVKFLKLTLSLSIDLFSSRYKTWTTIFHCLMFVKPTVQFKNLHNCHCL